MTVAFNSKTAKNKKASKKKILTGRLLRQGVKKQMRKLANSQRKYCMSV